MDNQVKLDFDIKRTKRFTLDDVDTENNIKINVTFIDEQKDLESALQWLSFAPKEIGVDIETRGLDPHTCELIMFQFGDEHRQFVIDTRKVDISSLIPYIINEDITIVGQNLKFEYKFIKHNYNVELINIKDTMIQEKALHMGYDMPNSLKALAKRYLGYEADKTIRMRFLEIEDDDFSKDEIIYGAYDVILPMLISKKQEKKIKEKEMEKLLLLEHEYVKVVGDIEYKGLYLDKNKWIELYNNFVPIYKDKLKKLNKFVLDREQDSIFWNKQLDMFSPEISCKISWSSSKQVIEYFKWLGICPKEFSKTTKKLSYTVDAKVLKSSLQTKNKNAPQEYKDLIKLYLGMKEIEQRVTTFGLQFLKHINPKTGRLHSNYNQIISTGRSSSSDPNLQNIPSDKEYRMCFTAPDSRHKIINADYSGQENVVLANKSLDKDLLLFYEKGNSDMHSFIASKIYKRPYEDYIEAKNLKDSGITLTSYQKKLLVERGIAKAAGFAINYGGNGFTISKNLGISEEEGNEVYEAYFEAFPGLKQYFDDTISKTFKRGYILINDLTKRRLNLKNFSRYETMKSKFNKLSKEDRKEFYKIKGQISRLALNAPVQGTAGDITKMAACRFRRWIHKNGYKDRVFITNVIHDEINVECPTTISRPVSLGLQKCMEDAGDMWCKTVKLKADAQIKDYWTH